MNQKFDQKALWPVAFDDVFHSDSNAPSNGVLEDLLLVVVEYIVHV